MRYFKRILSNGRPVINLGNTRSYPKTVQRFFNNIGISVEGARPKILPIEDQIKKRLAELLDIEKNRIGINATTGEDLTAFGQGEGLQTFVIVSLMKNEKN